MDEKKIKSFDGTEIFYKIKKQSKPFLIFLHGGSGSNHSWLFQEAEFINNDYSVIIPDLRGHGQSGRGRSLGFFKVENFCHDIKAIIDNENISKVTLVGHSLGGQI